MTSITLNSLEETFTEIIELMPSTFDSHAFIIKLAHRHQRLYVRALNDYANNDRPFQTVHGEISKRLHKFSHLVHKVGETQSEDIFGQVNSAALWEKID